MDSYQVIINCCSNSVRDVECCNVYMWIWITLFSVTVLISLAIIICKLISYRHEYRMILVTRPHVIVRTCYTTDIKDSSSDLPDNTDQHIAFADDSKPKANQRGKNKSK